MYLPQISRDPYLGEAEDVDAFPAGILDDGDGFRDAGREIDPGGFGLDCADADFGHISSI